MTGFRLHRLIHTGPGWSSALVAACLCLSVLCQTVVLACQEELLHAEIEHSLTGAPRSWTGGNLVVCVGTTVYFRAVDEHGNLASPLDLDKGCGQQQFDIAYYHWDFDYPGVPAEPSIDASGVAPGPVTFLESRAFTVRLDVDDEPGDQCLYNDVAVCAQITVTVVEPDIDTDSDNDGVIEEEDDPIEALYPGKYVEIDGALAEVSLAYEPTATGNMLRLQMSGPNVIEVYDSNGTTLLSPMPHICTIPTVPSSVYVKGLQEGSATLNWSYLDGSGNPVCTDTVRFTAVTSLPDEGLPDDNLNNAAGAARCNIRWSNPNTDICYADEFTLPSGSWIVDRIRMWAVPPVPLSPSYALGDHYSAIALYTGAATGSLSSAASGELTAGYSTVSNISPSGRTIACTPVTYTGGAKYQLPDGTYNQVWQIDFAGLNWSVAGNTTYRCGMQGTPRVDRLWFTHATHTLGPGNQFLSFSRSDGSIIDPDPNDPNVNDLYSYGSGWFGKGSDLNIQVFYHPQ